MNEIPKELTLEQIIVLKEEGFCHTLDYGGKEDYFALIQDKYIYVQTLEKVKFENGKRIY